MNIKDVYFGKSEMFYDVHVNKVFVLTSNVYIST